MVEVIGYLAAIALMLSGIPFAYRTYKAGYTDASLTGILLIVFGMLGMYWYEAATAASVPQLVDFMVGFICWTIVLKYRVAPRVLKTDASLAPWEYVRAIDGSTYRRRKGTQAWQLVSKK
jgi:uncharacterized protein with PQ loop repeat